MAALTCQKVDYVEARDWPLDKLQVEYCRTGETMRNSIAISDSLFKAGLRRDSQDSLDDARLCQQQQQMFGRVIENIHRAPLPSCK